MGEDTAARYTRPPSRSATKRGVWIGVALFAASLIVWVGGPLSAPLFPEEVMTNCTVQQSSASRRPRARVLSDCGSFRSKKTAVCTADPSLRVQLVAGTDYDFVVRGAHIPLVLSRTLASATVSENQPAPPDRGAKLRAAADALEELQRSNESNSAGPAEPPAEDPEDAEFRESIKRLEDQFSPETLRAFDYEQPPYSPECDASRRVMTTRGPQIMKPDRAAEVLRVPAGTTARDPLIPCDPNECRRFDIE
ncbi:hypothetical protein JOF28_001714 [Leucobacter exalbidus]|uniref:Uncharacterized protein n=1 Tax=Leucobacter exalbidus TaxID=662960 RepID=A0A940PM65_9MICO|nr:hypothetical protein [Leucobacter exalbidus]MBP1326482.1 hypothetical protein [Leucobacter exalbidus]